MQRSSTAFLYCCSHIVMHVHACFSALLARAARPQQPVTGDGGISSRLPATKQPSAPRPLHRLGVELQDGQAMAQQGAFAFREQWRRLASHVAVLLL